MDFLALCKRTVRESGTLSGTGPAAVTGQSGRLLKVVEWVASAWVDIQNRHPTWLWMRGEYTAAMVIGTARYLSSAASFNLTRWGYWITRRDSLTIYDPAIGVADENPLAVISWEEWRAKYDRGVQTNKRPTEYAISPSGELCFGPIPDKAYVVKGEYQKSPQDLTGNTDVPEMPANFHILIVWEALLYVDEHDEAGLDKAQRRRQDVERALELSQLPTITFGEEATLA